MLLTQEQVDAATSKMVELLFAQVARTGVTVQVAAQSLGVTGQSLRNWANGNLPRSLVMITNLRKVVEKLTGFEDGALKTPESREAFVKEIRDNA